MTKHKNIVLDYPEINERAKRLLQRLRYQGVWQYSRWFGEVDGRYNGDGAIQDRMHRLFNGKGTPLDTNLLLELEAIADKHLES